MAQINGYRIKMNFLNEILCDIFWDRKIPRNIFDIATLGIMLVIGIVCLPVLWALMHVPIIWPEMLGSFVGGICVLVLFRPYTDWTRAVITLIVVSFLLFYDVRFGAEIFGFHIEHYLYYIAIAASVFALWRRLWNWLAWSQIDRICDKYEIPRYDQKALMDAYEGHDTHYGEKKSKAYRSYSEAVAAEQKQEQ